MLLDTVLSKTFIEDMHITLTGMYLTDKLGIFYYKINTTTSAPFVFE